MKTFTKKRLHAEVLERVCEYLESLDKDLDNTFDYYEERLSDFKDEPDSYNYISTKETIEELNEKSKFLEKIAEHLEKLQL